MNTTIVGSGYVGLVADADFGLVKELMHSPMIFDGRNQLDREMLVEMGFDHYGIGR
jgi:UDP-glucose 6-dehydrogenase